MKKISYILWNTSKNNPNYFSVTDYLEENAQEIRYTFLEYIHELKDKKIDGLSIDKFLNIDKNLSLWDLSRIVEKCPFKDDNILEILKIFFFVKNYKNINYPEKVVFYEITNKETIKVLKNYLNNKVIYSFENCKITSVRNDGIILNILRSVKFIIILFINSFLIKKNNQKVSSNEHQTINFFSYFAHLDVNLLKKNIYYSYQWTEIFSVITQFYKKINIFNHYVPSKSYKSVVDVNKINNNLKNSDNSNFYLIDSFYNFNIILKTLIKYVQIIANYKKIKKFQKIFFHNEYKIDLWPLHKKQYYLSMYGSSLVQNIIWIYFFKNILSKFKNQKIGFFLYEGQSWERALCYYWKFYNLKNLIGVAHSTIRFWDLRYHYSSKSFQNDNVHPHKVVVNGDMQYNELLSSNYPKDKIIFAEALRYLHLKKVKYDTFKKFKPKKIKIIVLGDVIYEYTKNLINLIGESFDILENYDLYLKFHPANVIKLPNAYQKKITIITNKMSYIISSFDIAIGSCSGSANLEFFLSGKPLYIYKDPKQLNLSPLRSDSLVKFFQDKIQLANILKIKYSKFNKIDLENYFLLNNNIPLWKEIIKKNL